MSEKTTIEFTTSADAEAGTITISTPENGTITVPLANGTDLVMAVIDARKKGHELKRVAKAATAEERKAKRLEKQTERATALREQLAKLEAALGSPEPAAEKPKPATSGRRKAAAKAAVAA